MNRVATIECPCPPTAAGTPRHPDGDRVTFRETLDFTSGMTARNRIILAREEDPGVSAAEILTMLTSVYLLDGVEAWTLVDANREPIPVTRGNIRRYILGDMLQAIILGDFADELYRDAVMLPLIQQASTSSRPMPMAESTSPTNGEQPEAAGKPSKRSSTITIPTDATEKATSSPAGVSN